MNSNHSLEKAIAAHTINTDTKNELPENSKEKNEQKNASTKSSEKKMAKNTSSKLSPEEIHQKRLAREAKRKARNDALIAKGLHPDYDENIEFIKRPMLSVLPSDATPPVGIPLTIMSYNMLAQSLIRRKMFPTSGNVLKWFVRSKLLSNEFIYYKPDIMCLQEVDYIQYQNFWKEKFSNWGYESQFYRNPTKNHGCCISWKKSVFQQGFVDRMLIDYDKEPSGDIEPRTTTKNIGIVLALKFQDSYKQKFAIDSKTTGIIIGTTHLFWHPFGTFERTRQTFVVLNKIKEFQKRINILNPDTKWYSFFCGDFNSQPFDTPYLSITSKPINYDSNKRMKTVIECSLSFKFSKKRDGDDGDDEEDGNIELSKDQPQSPVPSDYQATEEQYELCQRLQKVHNSLNMRAISLYSIGYGKVHPENANVHRDRGEPEISNWAHTWRGLLDYIFFIRSWDTTTDCTQIDDFDTFAKENDVLITKYLRLPPASEMTEHGQPHEKEYGSDHLSIMCEVYLK
ncbi:related to RNA exonuclease NGL2 [Saccharomycodes ludwigii]|uniref:Related to RNA exonuclease NGL2 n=1 Tax=Saccharomycodes ludwigii TaxID=36035 RepID=A0A376B525_9ASCO|nr:related to RNA exonuclease NGL2 [Saccharomycodes ludwigii]